MLPTLIQRMILFDMDGSSIPTRYFFLAVSTIPEEPKVPEAVSAPEADFTQKSFALKALFPSGLSLNSKIISGMRRINSMYN